MKLSSKMIFIGATAVVAMLVLFTANFMTSNSVKEAIIKGSLRNQQLGLITDMQNARLKLNLAAMDAIVDRDTGDVSKERMAIIIQNEKVLIDGLMQAEKIADTDQKRKLAQQMIKNVNNLIAGIKIDMVDLIRRSAPKEEFAQIDNVIDQYGNDLARQLGDYEDSVRQEVAEANEALLGTIQTTTAVGIGVFVVALAMMAAVITMITLSIVKPINSIVKDMTSGAEHVSGAAGQVSASGQTLAEGASEQAAAIEETSASMEEMLSMTKQNADNAGQADSLMREALSVISTADTAMDEMSKSMEEISAVSEETSKIVKTIDEIAFQTNLLALNAAVEAARAGEAGAGFAVVADEVRNLAMRAAEAARNSSELIEGIVSKVSLGKGVVTKTNAAFKEVAESSSKVGTLVDEISVASKEQTTGFVQISQAISQMDAVTQQNAATAEESAAAAEELSGQAEVMIKVVLRLRALAEGDGGGSVLGSIQKRRVIVPKAASAPATRRQALAAPKKLASAKPAASKPGPEKPAPVKLAAVGPKTMKKPEDVIPMDDDDGDFEDF